jgi:hypothetical protein
MTMLERRARVIESGDAAGAGQAQRCFHLFRLQIHIEEPFSFLTILETVGKKVNLMKSFLLHRPEELRKP